MGGLGVRRISQEVIIHISVTLLLINKDQVSNVGISRTGILWFLMSRIADLKFGVMCPVVRGYRTLPLPAPGPLWNARTSGEWRTLRDSYRRDVGRHTLRTFGDLVEARSQTPDSELGKQLNDWYASCDQLGILLSLATTMV